MNFNSKGNGSSSLIFLHEDDSKTIIDVTTLDEEIKNDVPTFIKMDIEGAEFEALIGAKNIIKTYAPKLAISVYHKAEDIFDIPSLILEYNPNYKFYLRHYSLTTSETVLYAIA